MSGLIWTPPGLALPAYPLDIDCANPLARDLVRVLQLGGSPSVERVTQAAITLTGGRPGGGPFGPARGLYSTFGGATSDRAAVALPAFSGKRSHLVIFYQNGGGGSTAGRLYDRASKERLNYTGLAGNPLYYGLVNTATGDIGVTFSGVATYGKRWNVFVGTADQPTVGGAVTFQAWLNGIAQALTVSGSASGTVGTDAGDLIIGNRNAGDRGWDGLIALVAVWDRVLTEGEALALSRDPGRIFRRAPSQIWIGPAGGAVTHTSSGALAGAGATTSGTATRLALHTASGALAGAGATIAGSATLTPAAATHAGSGALAGAGAAIAGTATRLALHTSSGALAGAGGVVAGTATLTSASITISNPPHGSLDLTACSVTAGTPTINLKCRWIGEVNTTGARCYYGKVSGVNGLTPEFKVDRSNFEIAFTQKALWSATGDMGDWHLFDNFTSDASFFTFSNASAFAANDIYIACTEPWLNSYTLPWIQSLESSGYVSEAPSSAGSGYVFHTRSATTNGATSGAGDVIPALDLYSFKISSGGLAPDGLPKRPMVMMAGIHAAEDVGNYSLKGAVEFLISGDSQAATVRDWFDVYVYPLVASAGRYGGNGRGDFEDAHKTYDANRHWTDTTMETIVAHKAAIATDAGTAVPVMLDFHGDHLSASNNGYYGNTGAGANYSAWVSALQVYRPGISISTGLSAGSFSKWAADSLNCAWSINPEHIYKSTLTQSEVEDFGADHLRAIADLAAAGEWEQRNATGALAGAGAQLSGVAVRFRTHDAIGALAGAGAQITGAASKPYNGVFTESDLAYLVDYLVASGAIPTASEIAAAVLAAAAVTPIDANVKEVNDVAVTGTGVPPTYDVTLPTVLDPGDPWRPA